MKLFSCKMSKTTSDNHSTWLSSCSCFKVTTVNIQNQLTAHPTATTSTFIIMCTSFNVCPHFMQKIKIKIMLNLLSWFSDSYHKGTNPSKMHYTFSLCLWETRRGIPLQAKCSFQSWSTSLHLHQWLHQKHWNHKK